MNDASRPACGVMNGPNVSCRNCALYDLCLPVGVGREELDLLEKIIARRRILRRGQTLYQRGERFRTVYAIKSGSFKSFAPISTTHDQVTGFHLPGELMGLEGVGGGECPCTAQALETASLCEVPFDRLEELANVVPTMQRELLRIMGGQIRHDLQMQLVHCKRSAEARLAAFLVQLSARITRRGFSGAEFRLSMSREDIGSYLGLAKETVIRLFAQFQAQQLVSVERRQLRVHDLYRLVTLAGLDASEI